MSNINTTIQNTLNSLITEWQDKQRIIYLFSKLGDSKLQPKQYQEKLNFWKRVLNVSLENGLFLQEDSLSLIWAKSYGNENLMKKFENFGFVPVSLFLVWDELIKSKDLVRAFDYVKTLPLISGECEIYDEFIMREGGDDSIFGVFNYLFETVKSFFSSEEQPVTIDYSKKDFSHDSFIFVPFIDSLAKKVISQSSSSELIQSFEEFHLFLNSLNLFKSGNVHLSKNDTYIMLGYLKHLNFVSVKRSNNTNSEDSFLMIKFNSVAGKRDCISQEEEGVLTLRRTIIRMQAQLDELSAKEKRCIEQAIEAKRNKQISLAKKFLLTKKVLTPAIEKHLQHIHQLETMLIQINNVKADAKILKAYEVGSKALEQVLQKENMNFYKVEETMDYVKNVLEEAANVDDVIQQYQGEMQQGPSDEELERELELLSMEEELEAEDKIKLKLEELPSIPETELEELEEENKEEKQKIAL